MTPNELFYSIHKRCYEQRANLAAAGPLVLDTTQYTPDTLDKTLAEKEINAVMSYLLSADATKVSLEKIVEVINKTYANQPFWKELLVDYLAWKSRLQKERLIAQKKELWTELNATLQQINDIVEQKKMIITTCAEKIKKKKFPVDAKKLLTNYIHAAQIDAEKAWQTLITTPAYFSPIITTNDKGKTVISPKEAANENERLARFFRTFKF